MNRTRTSIIALGALALVGCQLLKKKDPNKPLGSCTKQGDMFTGASSVCREYPGDKPACVSGETASDQACPKDATLVGGCQSYEGFKQIEWYYNDPAKGGTATFQKVGTFCVSTVKGKTLMPDGSEKSGTAVVADDAKQYEATHGAKARTTLANVAAIATKLPAPTGKVNLEGLKGEALVVHKEDLGNLENPKKLEYRIAETGTLASCSRLLNHRPLQSDHGYDIKYCAEDPIFVVLAVNDYSPPTATGSSVSGNTKTTYVKRGSISGDALFFRTDNGKYLGSTKIGASNDDPSVTSPQIMTEKLLDSWPGAALYQIKKAAPAVTNINFTLKK